MRAVMPNVRRLDADERGPDEQAAENAALVYSVGWLAAWQGHDLRRQWRYTVRQVKCRNWRAVRNTFNGYLAEHDGHPHNCGKGWTKRAAVRRVVRLCRVIPPETTPDA